MDHPLNQHCLRLRFNDETNLVLTNISFALKSACNVFQPFSHLPFHIPILSNLSSKDLYNPITLHDSYEILKIASEKFDHLSGMIFLNSLRISYEHSNSNGSYGILFIKMYIEHFEYFCQLISEQFQQSIVASSMNNVAYLPLGFIHLNPSSINNNGLIPYLSQVLLDLYGYQVNCLVESMELAEVVQSMSVSAMDADSTIVKFQGVCVVVVVVLFILEMKFFSCLK